MKTMLQIGAIYGAIAVGVGAFGAHALKASLQAAGRFDTFETAVRYQFYHALALLAVGILLSRADPGAAKWLTWAGYAFAAGVLIFSGSLYTICFTGITKFGAVAPIGGLLMIAGWVLLFWAAGKLTL